MIDYDYLLLLYACIYTLFLLFSVQKQFTFLYDESTVFSCYRDNPATKGVRSSLISGLTSPPFSPNGDCSVARWLGVQTCAVFDRLAGSHCLFQKAWHGSTPCLPGGCCALTLQRWNYWAKVATFRAIDLIISLLQQAKLWRQLQRAAVGCVQSQIACRVVKYRQANPKAYIHTYI